MSRRRFFAGIVLQISSGTKCYFTKICRCCDINGNTVYFCTISAYFLIGLNLVYKWQYMYKF
ncbi:hypothetical protein PRUPE_7G219000 [Prunus persica]|uniref:Uncharacterized protein n=1 Tax=Prunus persica TaxID=3760 RepID=A0A251NF10_PRUPE|nr:hypothetical protein PRUPE_7G219000 [Prunus persica]